MIGNGYNSRTLCRSVCLLGLLVPPLGAQMPDAPTASSEQGVLLDRVLAVVNGDLVLESDLDEERRLQAFQPLAYDEAAFSRQEAVRRLIDRTLILQQARLQPGNEVSDADVQTEIAALRHEIPACQAAHCETAAGWNAFLKQHGFTASQLSGLWKQRMEVLRFIELRFRMGIRIAPEEVQAYYANTLLPQYARQKATAPPLDTVADRIREILLQRQVGALLDEWLKSLRAQGTVRILGATEVRP